MSYYKWERSVFRSRFEFISMCIENTFSFKLLGNHYKLAAIKLHLPHRLYLFLCPQQWLGDLLIFWKVLYWNLKVLFIPCFWVILFENLWKNKRSLRHWGQIKSVFKSWRRVIAPIWKNMVRARTHKYRLKELSVLSIKKAQWSDEMTPWAILFLLRWKKPQLNTRNASRAVNDYTA